ncbi:TPA: type II toxin-antitoxin system RelE/ParE family toxin [Pseudomonas aeruginosa]|uniref:type II toxin-antitoxin system RelE/ParE family toxin n=1 Tax=Pseudomonas aeruginosa TaxID=287 RepID=UPI001052834E|nr:type II toxin-antitoxin system RelE/ParE family toxin [Pseudomonas aeruginosa]HCE6896222.1 type II toxin-antitoxin system RelE/ParE family toxin [Pseudomonas aeruginosa]HCE6904742.1 type II toxin-antitoxin system RelE/ParE family toxin [Pseudomonas aeruginosa]HCE7019130.1 type II toxin-antitoxin system RelE/ParE family toxin [Pseudomonas aeruginosa]HCE7063551.1 type II toxin-antitoxin system RelE/ParE family toxin [Pseudomonas aeruginosa]HCE7349281.1 type II toxin-antitoxin system RelE/ParE
MIFVETPVFTKQILALVDDEAYRKLQEDLTLHPDAGVVIEGTGGLRKIRIAANGHGKRGGARVIYYHFVTASQIAFLYVYDKAGQVDMTADQKKVLRQLIEKWR